MDKEFKTIDEQIEILKNRNLNLDDEYAKELLINNNYYYLINGYKDLFVEFINCKEEYVNNATLYEIYALYNFDSEFRINILKYILKIERKIDTYIAYEFSKQYGNKDYLKVENFDNINYRKLKIKTFIEEIESDMALQNQKSNKMLNHYINKYGYVPLWVLIRILTFGQASKFYKFMKQKDQNAIAQKFGIREKELKVFLYNLAIVRNICAHDEKLYDLRLKNAIMKNDIHKKFNLELKDGVHSFGFKDMFSIIIILKKLLSSDDFSDFFDKLTSDLNVLENNLTSVYINVVLDKMGFPKNYKDIMKKETSY